MRLYRFLILNVVCWFFYFDKPISDFLPHVSAGTFETENNWAVTGIPDSLTKDANVVVRLEEEFFHVYNKKTATYSLHSVKTIMNSKGDGEAQIVLPYSPAMKLSVIDINVYDKAGVLVKKVKKNEIQDYSAISGANILQDDRVKIVDVRQPSYPFTVEVSYRLDFDGILGTPKWMPVNDENVSVQRSTFTLGTSPEAKIRYKEWLVQAPPQVTENSEGKTIVWALENYPAKENEHFSQGIWAGLPTVITAPYEFEMAGYEGQMDTWDNFGKWIVKLNKDRDELPLEVKTKIDQLLKGVSDEREKAKILYEYLQGHTRYVSVQLGIGGYQPFDAQYVHDNGYGDCKALSNFMHSILKYAGIKSNYFLVRAGSNSYYVDNNFPSTQFNHAALCVPFPEDTVWLECTSQTMPFGFIGDFTDDRYVLLITENGGEMVKTKQYGLHDNLLLNKADVVLKADGFAEVTSTSSYNCMQYNDVHRFIQLENDEQEKWLHQNIDMDHFNLKSFSVEEFRSEMPSAVLNMSSSIDHYGKITGTRMFFTPNLMNRQSSIRKQSKPRESNVYFRRPYLDIDTVHINFPEGYHLENVPDEVVEETAFGTYKMQVIADENGMTYIRYMAWNKGTFPKDDYDAFIEFVNKVAKNDRMKLVLVKAT